MNVIYRSLAAFLFLFSSSGFSSPSPLASFRAKYVVHYPTGGGSLDSTLVLGAFEGEHELVGISKRGKGSLFLLNFQEHVDTLVAGMRFVTLGGYQPISPKLQILVGNDWRSDDSFFSFAVKNDRGTLAAEFSSGLFELVPVTDNAWTKEFSDVTFTSGLEGTFLDFVGTYEGIDPEGRAVVVTVHKGFGIFGKDLLVDMAYPAGVHVQLPIDFPVTLPMAAGRGGAYLVRSRFEAPNKIVSDQFRLLDTPWKRYEISGPRRIYELVDENGTRKLQIKDVALSLFRGKESVRNVCKYALRAAAQNSLSQF